MKIKSRTDTILTEKKVLTLRTLVQTLDRKCHEMQVDIDNFKLNLAALQSRGLPNLLTSTGRLLTREQYATRVNNYVSNRLQHLQVPQKKQGLPLDKLFMTN